MVPVFYNPQDLGPVGDDGNRVILIAFDDQYGSRFDVGPHTSRMEFYWKRTRFRHLGIPRWRRHLD